MNLTPTLSTSTNAQCSAKERELFKAADFRIKNYKYPVKMNDSQPNL
jgi:hypothetical protein